MTHAATLTRVSNNLGPVLALAVLTMLLAGCATKGTVDVTTGSSSSSVVSAAMEAKSSSSLAASSAPSAAQSYEDGTYAAAGNYRSPAGTEEVQVTLTLQNDIITAAIFKGMAVAPKSVTMQGKFAAGFEEAVVGKSIDELSLTVVNGSSLTPMGFMEAVAKIKAEAKA